MWFRGLAAAVGIVLLLLAANCDGCGDGAVKLEMKATFSRHRLQVSSVGHDLMFLMITPTGYQAARVPDVALAVATISDSQAVLRAGDGTTLTLSVVADTPSLYLVKVSWTGLTKEIWDCKELSEFIG